MRIYQMIGQLEGSQAVANMLQMEDVLKANGFTDEEVISKVVPDGEHNEALWRQEFAEAYLWMFVSFANNIDEKQSAKPLFVFPNPAADMLNCKNVSNSEIRSITLLDSSGRNLNGVSKLKSFPFNISSLPAGLYIIKLKTSKGLFIGRFVKGNS